MRVYAIALLLTALAACTSAPETPIFSSIKECEATMNCTCDFLMCDYIPEGKTYEEVCGKNFREGVQCVGKASEPEGLPCKASDRLTEYCAEIYQPVCGWNDKTIQCFAYPCAQTFSNKCEACKTPHVAYVTKGECPEP